jgi:flagellar hook-associated protein 3 FlgL
MRVSDNTSAGAVRDALKRTRTRLEDLQIKNATQKRIVTPSDDPVANTKIMDIRTQSTVHGQFDSNANVAKNRLTMTDAALNEVYDLIVRAKEIAINQSSAASANSDSRLGVAQEVSALYKQLVSVANRRVGEHYIFGGFKTLTPAYTSDGQFLGDTGEIPVEIQKDVFISMNLPGTQVFDVKRYHPEDKHRAPSSADRSDLMDVDENAPPADLQNAKPAETISIFHELDALRVGLMANDTGTIRDTLDGFDDIIKHIITVRAKVSSRVSGIDTALGQTARVDVANAELATKLEDADYAELWSNMAKEETVLRSSLSSAQKLIQPTLLDFLR